MTIDSKIIKDIIARVIQAKDYRLVVLNKINVAFLNATLEFFKHIVEAKLASKDITIEWYKKCFLNQDVPSDEVVIYAGLNTKTISNIRHSTKKEVVLETSKDHFNLLYETINELIANNSDVDTRLTIKIRDVSVDLNISESLVVINALAVKRAALRGGMWSSLGKQVEKGLMVTLCQLYKVAPQYYKVHFVRDKQLAVDREVDFYLCKNDKNYRCEVKLMGKGNPESADAIIARDTDVFIADTLSEQNKQQCEQLGIVWVECSKEDGFRDFTKALKKFHIPYTDYQGDLGRDLPAILDDIDLLKDK